MANIKFEVILGMLFLKISNANMSFGEKKSTRKSYTTNKILLTINQVQPIDPKKFVITILDESSKTFVIYMAIWKQEKMAIDLDRKI